MAIVRTTKEVNTSGSTPPAPADKTKSVVSQSRVPARQAARRPVAAPGAQVQAPRSGRTFIHETLAELRRVVWPTHREVEAGTIVTIGLLIFFALYIFVLDVIARQLFVFIGLLPPGQGQ